MRSRHLLKAWSEMIMVSIIWDTSFSLWSYYIIRKEKVKRLLTYIRLELQELLLGRVWKMDGIRYQTIGNEFCVSNMEYAGDMVINGDER